MISPVKAAAALDRMRKSGHVNREVVEDLWERGKLTEDKLDFLENAPYVSVPYNEWKRRRDGN